MADLKSGDPDAPLTEDFFTEKVTLDDDSTDLLEEPEKPKTCLQKCWQTEPDPVVENPLFPVMGQIGKKLSDHPWHLYFIIGYLVFFGLLSAMLYYLNTFAATTPYGEPQFLGCPAHMWGACGVNGTGCLPYESDWEAFRCEAFCTPNYKRVIGTGQYRADSQLCSSASHAGIIGYLGGCFLARASGPANGFVSSAGGTGIVSYNYSTYFPKTFEVKACPSSFCVSIQWLILAVNLVATFGLLLMRVPRWVFFGFLMHAGWWYIGISGSKDSDHTDYYLAKFTASFIPSFGIAFILYKVGKKAIFEADFPVDNFIFYALPTWIAIHWQYLVIFFADIDLAPSRMQNFAWGQIILTFGTALVVGGALILPQIWVIFKTGRLRYYVAGYVSFIVGFLIVALIARNHLEFHIHHYFLAIFAWPITRFNTRSSALLQGVLFGMFINGGARWGFDSLLEYSPNNRFVAPTNLHQIARDGSHVTLAWNGSSCSAYSLWMNDYEMYRGAVPSTTVDLPVTSVPIFYDFCVRCIVDGVMSSICSARLLINSTVPW